MKIKVLNIATILPYPARSDGYTIKENDFLVTLSYYLEKMNINFELVKVVNYSNKILGSINDKWKYYYDIPEEYFVSGHKIRVIRQVAFPKDKLKALSLFFSIVINRNKLEKYLDACDCTHAHYLLIDGYFSYTIYKKYKLPYVVTVRDEICLFDNIILRNMVKRIIKSAKYVVTTNKVNKERLLKYIDKDIKLIPHGVVSDNLYLDLNVNDTIIITTVSKLVKGKRIDILIKALEMLQDINYELNIIGDGPEYEYLKSISSKVNCNFKGELSYYEVIQELKIGDVFVLPSESESFGRVYIEALASSNAVVAVEGTGIDGLFKNNQEVIYMKKNSVSSLYEILNELLRDRDKIRKMKLKGYQEVKKNYTWDKVSQMYRDLYEDIIKN